MKNKKINLQELLDNTKVVPHYVKRMDIEHLTIMPPISVELHWTSACNYDCIHCSYGSRRLDKGKISQDDIKLVVEDLIDMKCKSIYLSGGGEPTVFFDWDKYVNELMNANIDVALITNGVLINEKTINIVKDMNYVAVSVYSTIEADYNIITGSNKFQEQFNLAKRIKKQNTRTIVGARCVINSTNYKDIIDIYDETLNNEFDYIIFIPAIDYENSGIALSSSELNYIKLIISNNIDLIDNTKTNLLSILKKDIQHYEPADYRNDMKSHNTCSMLDIRSNAFINYDGCVYLCQPHIGNEDYSIGNISKRRFTEIWNSKKHIEVLNKLNQEFSEGECKYCRAIGFNKAIDKFKNTDNLNSETYPIDNFI